ncbi:MAG: hypothetical protein A2437_05910 [Bacteroidetes bacterium RIFOXYC2_FULL_40_12]|nr:MAG: hypothetical protein A2437_05910 [Bacteroidetes bacterium RIFOXYC2_FULL_40_12]
MFLFGFLIGCKNDEKPEYSLLISIVPENSGSVEYIPHSASYPEGTEVTLSPSPVSNYKFLSWGGVDAPYVHNNKIVMSKDMGIVANFSLNTYSITASVNPDNSGTITGAGTYEDGETVSLTAIAASGYLFINWSENGTQVSTEATYSFTANANRTLVANFDLSTSIRLQSGSGLNSGASLFFVALSKSQNYFNLTTDELFAYQKTSADWYIDGGIIPFLTDYKEFDLPVGEYYFLLSGSGTVMVTTITVLQGKQTFLIYASGYSLFVNVISDTKGGSNSSEKPRRTVDYKRPSAGQIHLVD